MEVAEQLDCSEIQSESTLKDHLLTNSTTAMQSLKKRKNNSFSCIQCTMRFTNQSKFKLHLESNEHAIMVLASGFDEEVIKKRFNSLPPLYCCLLCTVWCFNHKDYVIHLKDKVHKKVANNLRILLIGDNKLNVVGNSCSCESKIFSGDLYLPLHYCELCDIWWENCKSFTEHTRSKKHKGMNEFCFRMCNSNMMDVLNICSTENSENVSDSLSKTDFCHLCNFQSSGRKSYEAHLNGEMHTKIEQLMTKIIEMKKKENVNSTCLKTIHFDCFEKSLQMLRYCDICQAWFKNHRDYNDHLKYKFHKRVKCLHRLIGKKDSSIKEESFQPLQESEDLIKLHSLAHHCKSCNIVFNATEHFDQHLKSALHSRTEQFINRIRQLKPTINTDNISDTPDSDNVLSLLPLLHYCELCNIWSDARNHYDFNGIHRRIETFISNINNEQVSSVIPPHFYCELCDIQFNNSKLYRHHLEGEFHIKVKSLVNRILIKKKKNLNSNSAMVQKYTNNP